MRKLRIRSSRSALFGHASRNGRGLDMRLRLPPGYEGLEARIREAVAKRVDGLPGRAKTWIELRLHRTRLRKTTSMRRGVSFVSRFHVGLLACQADRTGNATSQTSSVGPADPKSVK